MPEQHADSHYHRQLPGEASRPPPRGRLTVEVCVVGGGLAGLGVALGLAEAGVGVGVLEAGKVGCGASGRNGGFVSAGYALGLEALQQRLGHDHARRLARLSRHGVALVRERIARHAIDAATPAPGMLLAWRHRAAAEVQAHCRMVSGLLDQQRDVWPRERLRETLASERYFAAVYDDEAFHCQPLAYARGLARAAESAGATVYEDARATRIDRRGGGWQVHTGQSCIDAAHVVLAGSADLGRLDPRLTRAVLPVATYMMATEPLGERLASTIRTTAAVADTRSAGDYYRVLDGRILWGGRMTTRATPPAHLAHLLRADLLDVYPQLGAVRVECAWSGLMGYARHRMPLVGRFPGGPWYCTAFGGHGLNTTAVGAELVARAIATGDDEYRLFEPFAPVWGGGAVGRLVAQTTYWHYRLGDLWRERHARRRPAP